MALFGKKKPGKKQDDTEEILEITEENEENADSTESNIDDTESSSSDNNDEETTDENIDDDLEERDLFENADYDKKRSKNRPDKNTSELIDEVIEYFTQVEPIKLNLLERGKLKKDNFVLDVKAYIASIVRDEDKQAEVFNGFESFIWRYDVLDELIEDDDVSDIKVYDWDHIRVKRLGKRMGCDINFRSERHYIKFIEHVAIKNKVSISDQNAAQNFVDKESSPDAILRFNITTGFINSSGKPVLHIRKIPKHKLTEEKLIELGFFDKKTADYLKKRITEGGGFLFAGKGGSGKTTAINWLIDYVPHDMSGLVIQENEELFSDHPDMAFEHTVQNRGEGKIEYNLGDLARNGLLTDIDVFIIGEIKGAEALYLLNAVYTGAKGWASVHGASSTEAMKKLVDYIKYNSDYSQEEALQMLLHLDTIIFMDNFSVKEIAEVTGYDAEKGNLVYKRVL